MPVPGVLGRLAGPVGVEVGPAGGGVGPTGVEVGPTVELVGPAGVEVGPVGADDTGGLLTSGGAAGAGCGVVPVIGAGDDCA